jgi:hypothetical protein
LLPSSFKLLNFKLSKIKDSQLERELLCLGESARNENCCQEKMLAAWRTSNSGVEEFRLLGKPLPGDTRVLVFWLQGFVKRRISKRISLTLAG